MEIIPLGQIIRQRREELLLKQEDLAEMATVTIKTLYMIENGKGNPSLGTLNKLLDILGLEIDIRIKKMAE